MVKRSGDTETKQRVKVVNKSERLLESRLKAADKAYEWFVDSPWMSPYSSGDEQKTQWPKRWQEYCDDHKLWGIAKQDVYSSIDECLDSDDPVLILGASGTGKELVCDAIHRHGNRKGEKLIKINLAGLSTELILSELFGHVKGAFTGAIHSKEGAFQTADKGTVFLDEIGELTPKDQKKLLRFLQDGSFERVGESGIQKKVNVRVIAATNKDIDKRECRDEIKFRDDLFYRLCGIPIRLTPLSSSYAEVAYLTARFLVEVNRGQGECISCLPFDFVVNLLLYDWPGNVRQLEHALRFVFRHVRKKLIEYKKVKNFIKQNRLPSTGSEYLRNCMKEFSGAFFRYIGPDKQAQLAAKAEDTIVPRLPYGYDCYKGVPLPLDVVCSRIQAVPLFLASSGVSDSPYLIYIKLLAGEIDRSETFRKLAPQYLKLCGANVQRERTRPLPATGSSSINVPFKKALGDFKIAYFERVFETDPDATNASITRLTGADPGTVAKYRKAWRKKNPGK